MSGCWPTRPWGACGMLANAGGVFAPLRCHRSRVCKSKLKTRKWKGSQRARLGKLTTQHCNSPLSLYGLGDKSSNLHRALRIESAIMRKGQSPGRDQRELAHPLLNDWVVCPFVCCAAPPPRVLRRARVTAIKWRRLARAGESSSTRTASNSKQTTPPDGFQTALSHTQTPRQQAQGSLARAGSGSIWSCGHRSIRKDLSQC